MLREVEPLGDYANVRAETVTVEIDGAHYEVLNIDRLIEVKEHVGRPKDLRVAKEHVGRPKDLRVAKELKAIRARIGTKQ